MKSAIIMALYIGVVDSVDSEFANVEITTSNDMVLVTLPVAMFPCDIEEGDMFYFEHVDGVTEIRCGEPE
jgi:hypothetical protein|tara:strand:- start:1207 stop:1416 length:210 start_codon:yes stop_codon:yes gene_type:complete